jgi:hypothetical protein
MVETDRAGLRLPRFYDPFTLPQQFGYVIPLSWSYLKKEEVPMKTSQRLTFGMVALMVLVGVWAVPAAAAPRPPTAVALRQPKQERHPYRGKYAYKRALLRVGVQQDRIKHAQAAASLAGEYLADEKAAGYDTSMMETALVDLRGKLTEAQGHNETAIEILQGGAGFDEEGYATDLEQARETMRAASEEMREAGRALHEGNRELRQAFREYRRSKRGE